MCNSTNTRYALNVMWLYRGYDNPEIQLYWHSFRDQAALPLLTLYGIPPPCFVFHRYLL